MVFPVSLWLLFAAALLISVIGFKKYIWFFSVGYGFSIAGEGVLLLILFGMKHALSAGAVLCCLIFVLYGCRLGAFLALRERKSAAYHKTVAKEIRQHVSLFAKGMIWGACALLYLLMVLPVFYRLNNQSGDHLWTFIGAAVMLCGVLLEAAADAQKARHKRHRPDRFVSTGLFRIVRCPNYLGELVLWTGVVLSGVGAVSGWQWAPVLTGYLGIVYVMFSGARRLEIRQNRNYGGDPAYQNYVRRVPILLPLLPLYSVEKYAWLVA